MSAAAAAAGSAVLQLQQAVLHTPSAQHQLQTSSGISFRGLQPRDFDQVKAVHADLFPIDYEDGFFIRATQGLDRIWSCAAVVTDAYGSEQLVGFITAKSVLLHEVDPSDRQHMGLLSAVLDHDRVLYIMTLGVVQGHRHRGLASTLIAIACQHAYETRCRAVFLHVITYNSAAMSLYSRQGFSCVAKLRGFYFIATGRTPDPQQQVYDAYLFVQYVGGAAGMPSPWDLVSLAWSPLRLAFARMHACMPGFCRPEQEQQQQQGLLQEQAAAGWGDRIGSASSTPHHHQQPVPGYQQHQQQQVQPPQQLWHQQHQQPPYQSPPGGRHKHRGPDAEEQQGWQQFGVCHQPALNHQAMQPPQQRMLRWLFNGASRGGGLVLTDLQQQQQQQQHLH